MQRVLALICATILGGIGWWLGGYAGLMTAYLVSVVTSAAGWYIGTRIAQEYL
jgi:hypothetical protein